MEKKNLILLCLSVLSLIFIGTLIRITHSGLSCPDWPLCYGMLIVLPSKVSIIQNEIPYVFNQMIYEWFHRFYAGFVFTGLLIFQLTLNVKSFIKKREPYGLLIILIILVLLSFQISLGGLTVMKNNSSWSVGIHMIMALVIYGVLINNVVYLEARNVPFSNTKYQSLLWLIVLDQFVLAISGVLLSTSGLKYDLQLLEFTDPFSIVLIIHIVSFAVLLFSMAFLIKAIMRAPYLKIMIITIVLQMSVGIILLKSTNMYYQMIHQLIFLTILTYSLYFLWKLTMSNKHT